MVGQEHLVEAIGAEAMDAISDKKPVKFIRKYWNIITGMIILGIVAYSYLQIKF